MQNLFRAIVSLLILLVVDSSFAVEQHSVVDSIRAWLPRMEAQVGQVKLTREVLADQHTFQTVYKRGAQGRLEARKTENGKLVAVSVIDGLTGSAVLPVIGHRSVPVEDIILLELRWSPWSLIVDGARVVGADTANGLECWKLEIENLSRVSAAHLWVDKQWLIAQKGECTTAAGKMFSWIHSDFRPVVGHFSFPYFTQTFVSKRPTSQAIVHTLELNISTDDSLFDREKISLKE